MKESIDNPEYRRSLAEITTVKSHNQIPEMLLRKRAVLIGNYLGDEVGYDGHAHLLPTINGLVYIANLIAPEGKNRLLAVARKSLLDNMPDEFHAIKTAIIPAEKNHESGSYHISRLDTLRAANHLRHEGVLWMAPAATTESDGLKYYHHTGAVRLAREMANGTLVVIAMQTEGTGIDRYTRKVYLKEIKIPHITCSESGEKGKQLTRAANRAIGLYSLAETAELLPVEQRGELRDADDVKLLAKSALIGLRNKGLIVEGGFLSEE